MKNMDVKSQLYNYYIDILKEISSISESDNIALDNSNSGSLSVSELIIQIKESNLSLINAKISKIMSLNKNNNNYFQLENYIKKIEYDLKYYIRQFFEFKIQNDALEEKIKIYSLMQEEFEDLKDKVKYEGGRFLNNERKENEILILRQENSILKREISKFEKLQKLNETLKKDYMTKIDYLQSQIEQLNKTIKKYQESNLNINKIAKNNKNENADNAQSNNNINSNSKKFHKLNKALININNINNKENALTKWFSKLEIDSINNILTNRVPKNLSLNYKTNFKNLIQKHTVFTNKRPSNYNIIKHLYMNSNNSIKYNYNINSSSMSTVNTNNVFTCNYNKIINNLNNKNFRRTLKKKSGNKNTRKNNSVSMKLEKDEERSLTAKKFRYKSDKKKISTIQFDKIKVFKQIGGFPLSCKHKTISKIKRFKSKKIGLSNNYLDIKSKKNNSALNIRINSK